MDVDRLRHAGRARRHTQSDDRFVALRDQRRRAGLAGVVERRKRNRHRRPRRRDVAASHVRPDLCSRLVGVDRIQPLPERRQADVKKRYRSPVHNIRQRDVDAAELVATAGVDVHRLRYVRFPRRDLDHHLGLRSFGNELDDSRLPGVVQLIERYYQSSLKRRTRWSLHTLSAGRTGRTGCSRRPLGTPHTWQGRCAYSSSRPHLSLGSGRALRTCYARCARSSSRPHLSLGSGRALRTCYARCACSSSRSHFSLGSG